jgi:hypothetical protein
MDEETSAYTGTQGARSPMYCAPEVYFEGRRGRKADVFSLGCVFLEMATVLYGASLAQFNSIRRNADGSRAYAANPDKVLLWLVYLAALCDEASQVPVTKQVSFAEASYAVYWAFVALDPNPKLRPASYELLRGLRLRHGHRTRAEYYGVFKDCLSCAALLPRLRSKFRKPRPQFFPLAASSESAQSILNSPLEITWDDARSICLSWDRWLKASAIQRDWGECSPTKSEIRGTQNLFQGRQVLLSPSQDNPTPTLHEISSIRRKPPVGQRISTVKEWGNWEFVEGASSCFSGDQRKAPSSLQKESLPLMVYQQPSDLDSRMRSHATIGPPGSNVSYTYPDDERQTITNTRRNLPRNNGGRNLKDDQWSSRPLPIQSSEGKDGKTRVEVTPSVTKERGVKNNTLQNGHTMDGKFTYTGPT